MVRDETETFDFQSETRSRPRPSHVSTRPRRDRDIWKLCLETVSRPRRRDRDYIPGIRREVDLYMLVHKHVGHWQLMSYWQLSVVGCDHIECRLFWVICGSPACN